MNYIKLYKKIQKWIWYKDKNTFKLFVHFLLNVTYNDYEFNGKKLPAGSYLSSLRDLSEKTGLSIRQIRTSLKKLLATQEVTQKTTRKGTLYILTNYKSYNGIDEEGDTGSDTENDTRGVTKMIPQNEILTLSINKKIKRNIYNKKTLKEKKDIFANEIAEFNKTLEVKYERNLLKEFYQYWSESDRQGIKMRMELEKTWELGRRLSTWYKNSLNKKSFNEKPEKKGQVLKVLTNQDFEEQMK